MYQAILTKARRACDPFVQLRGQWIVRRLAPDCSRIELASLPAERDEARLLHAMGWETANIHLGSRDTAGAVRRDLERRRQGLAPTGRREDGPGHAQGLGGVEVIPWGNQRSVGGATILVYGILSLLLCGIFGPIAWLRGNAALRQLDNGEGDK